MWIHTKGRDTKVKKEEEEVGVLGSIDKGVIVAVTITVIVYSMIMGYKYVADIFRMVLEEPVVQEDKITYKDYIENVGVYLETGKTGVKNLEGTVINNNSNTSVKLVNNTEKEFIEEQAEMVYRLYKESNDTITKVVLLEYILGLNDGKYETTLEELKGRAYVQEIEEKVALELSKEPKKILEETLKLDGIESKYELYKKQKMKDAIAKNTEILGGTKDENVKYFKILGIDY